MKGAHMKKEGRESCHSRKIIEKNNKKTKIKRDLRAVIENKCEVQFFSLDYNIIYFKPS